MPSTFSFVCACGAKLQARPDMAGKKGKCKFCGVMVMIPSPPSTVTGAARWKAAEQAVAVREESSPVRVETKHAAEQTCSICQTAIQSDEAVIPCNACGLPFHIDCWQANYGCATYGCRNVNMLKPGPDIAIGQSALSQAQLPPWQQSLGPAGSTGSDVPWEFVLLAASALAGLLSCVTCGLPSLLVAGAAGVYLSQNPQANMKVLGGVWAVAGFTFLFGMIASVILWMS